MKNLLDLLIHVKQSIGSVPVDTVIVKYALMKVFYQHPLTSFRRWFEEVYYPGNKLDSALSIQCICLHQYLSVGIVFEFIIITWLI